MSSTTSSFAWPASPSRAAPGADWRGGGHIAAVRLFPIVINVVSPAPGRLIADLSLHRSVAHEDLYTEPVLFTPDGRLSAIIDLDGLDIGDGHGDLSALISDFANLEPELCAHVVRGYRTECEASGEDLLAAHATTIRRHLLHVGGAHSALAGAA